MLPLVDNYDEDKYEYELHVYTGVKAKSGTDSRIGFVLAGSESDTGIRKLADGKRQVSVIICKFVLAAGVSKRACSD